MEAQRGGPDGAGTPVASGRCGRTDWVRTHIHTSYRFGIFFACPPGMTQSLGADCSAPGISPCPFRGSRPT
eukprot:7126564-Prymnesium_polylepis.1